MSKDSAGNTESKRRVSSVALITIPSHLLHNINSPPKFVEDSQSCKQQHLMMDSTSANSSIWERSNAEGAQTLYSGDHGRMDLSAIEAVKSRRPVLLRTSRSLSSSEYGTRHISGHAPMSEQMLVPIAPLAFRKKSTVTFAARPTSIVRMSRSRKASLAKSGPITPLATPITPTVPTPVKLMGKNTPQITLTEISEDGGDVTKSTDGYFGNYGIGTELVPTISYHAGPYEAVATSDSTTSRRPTGWRWGGPRKLSRSASIKDSEVRRATKSSTHSGDEMRRGTILQRTGSVWQDAVQNLVGGMQNLRRGTVQSLYEKAKMHRVAIHRSAPVMFFFEYAIYATILAFVYFVFVGRPVWKGTAYWIWYLLDHRTWLRGLWIASVVCAMGFAYAPLCVACEADPLSDTNDVESAPGSRPAIDQTCLIIPCYKSGGIIGSTLEAAIKTFPPSHIFVIANGNSTEPLDDTEEVCDRYGVNHVWSSIGSKIVAQFVGCFAASDFKYALLIDDDCRLPTNFPVVTDRMVDNIHCIGYTIKSVGPNSTRGTWAQQAQDLEYKLAGLQRVLAGKLGSIMFPHGAISLWNREFLIRTFHQHPGFDVSEDWFFGHVARELGYRMIMCTSVFIETETPSSVFTKSGGSRGGFGETTVFEQRFRRWNFFFVNGMWYNLSYIVCSWKLGLWHELGTKTFCFQEVCETLLYLASPVVLPISFYIRPLLCLAALGITYGAYFLCAAIFNEVHLRRKNERVASRVVYLYYMPYKLVLTFVNVASCYYALFKYATYFAKRHPKIIEDERALEIVMQLEQTMAEKSEASLKTRASWWTQHSSQTAHESHSLSAKPPADVQEKTGSLRRTDHQPQSLVLAMDNDLRAETVVSPMTAVHRP